MEEHSFSLRDWSLQWQRQSAHDCKVTSDGFVVKWSGAGVLSSGSSCQGHPFTGLTRQVCRRNLWRTPAMHVRSVRQRLETTSLPAGVNYRTTFSRCKRYSSSASYIPLIANSHHGKSSRAKHQASAHLARLSLQRRLSPGEERRCCLDSLERSSNHGSRLCWHPSPSLQIQGNSTPRSSRTMYDSSISHSTSCTWSSSRTANQTSCRI